MAAVEGETAAIGSGEAGSQGVDADLQVCFGLMCLGFKWIW